MSHALDVVERFRGAVYGGDPHTARQLLADDLSFDGPAAHVAGADNYMRASEHAVAAVQHVETHKIFSDASDVAVFYDLYLNHSVGLITVADWFHVEGDKIAAIRTILDTGPFAAPSADTLVDPVCGMNVARERPAATRAHAETTYYFCSLACAEAFDSDPSRYIPAPSP